MSKNKDKPDLKKIVLTIDMGGSKTKAVVQEYPEGKPQVLLLDSEVADVGKASVENIQPEGLPEARAWVGIRGEYCVLGELARRRFGGILQLRELKYELAVPKVCGAIWLVKEKLNLLDNDVAVYLNILLPPGEVQDKEQLQTRLKEAFRGFETPGGKMRVKILHCDVSPEGAGIFFHRKRLQTGTDIPASMYVMLGYRNASVFIVRSGSSNAGITSNFGMSWLVDNFTNNVSGLSPDNPNIVGVIVEAGVGCDSQVMKKLSRKRLRKEIQLDGELMSKALLLARDEYWRAIVRWLRSKMEDDIKEVVFCGGTADYIRPEIDAYFQKERIKVCWHGDIFIPSEISADMGNRMADVWALHQYMIVQFDNLTGYARSEVVPLTKSSEDSPFFDTGDTLAAEAKPKYNFPTHTRPKSFITVNEKA